MNSKLSVWTAYFYDLSPEDAVLTFLKNGIHCAELSDEHGLMLLDRGDPKAVGQQFKTFLDANSFTMTQGHLWLSCKICSNEEDIPKLYQWLDLFEAIGIRNGVLHIDSLRDQPNLSLQERLDRNIQKLKLIETYLKQNQYRLRICLENLNKIATDIDQLNYMLDRLDPDCFGICLDTGHLNLTVKDQTAFILKAGNRLQALHIADNEGVWDQHKMPFSLNTKTHIDFHEVVAALRKIGYSGPFNLEIPGENRLPLPILEYKLEFIRKCYDYLMDTV